MKGTEISRRLKAAREQAGFKSASEAARQIGANAVTYTAHENGGREYDRATAIFYGTKFGVDPAWLLFGDELSLQRSLLESDIASPNDTHSDDAGGPPHMRGNPAPDSFRDFIETGLKIRYDRARIIPVQGDSMFDPADPNARGSLLPGDRVIVDTGDCSPSPPGAFALHDGVGILLKLAEVVPNSKPLMVRLSTRNPRYAAYEIPLNDVAFIGRVRAKVAPF